MSAKPPARPEQRPAIDYHVKVWTSGARGGGRVPPDFSWNTNPKQTQEEHGANALPLKPR